MTGRVHDMILDPKLTGQLPEVISEGSYYGMQTFDQHLLQHLQAGRVTMDAAMRVATSPHDFKLMVAASAKTGDDDGPEATIASPAPAPAPVVEEPVREPVAVAAPEQHEPAAPPSYEPPPAPPASEPAPSSPPPPSAPPPGPSF
jgi:twitching motility protein PilT